MAGPVHNKLAEMAMRWAGNRSSSFRCSPEIQVADGYIADAVVLGGLQHRFFMSYCKLWEVEPEVVMHWRPTMPENAKPQIPCSFAHIFEAKATRSDFLSTFGPSDRHQNRMTPVGTTHWVVTEPNVCTPDEVPSFWGLLVRRGRGLREIKAPQYTGYDERAMERLAYRILWKPDWQQVWLSRDGTWGEFNKCSLCSGAICEDEA